MLSDRIQFNSKALSLLIGPPELRSALLALEMLYKQLDTETEYRFLVVPRNTSINKAKAELLKQLRHDNLICVIESLDSPEKARLVLEVLDCGKTVWAEMDADTPDSAGDDFRLMLAQSIDDSELAKLSTDTLSQYWNLVHDNTTINLVSMHAALNMPIFAKNLTRKSNSANEEIYMSALA